MIALDRCERLYPGTGVGFLGYTAVMFRCARQRCRTVETTGIGEWFATQAPGGRLTAGYNETHTNSRKQRRAFLSLLRQHRPVPARGFTRLRDHNNAVRAGALAQPS